MRTNRNEYLQHADRDDAVTFQPMRHYGKRPTLATIADDAGKAARRQANRPLPARMLRALGDLFGGSV